MSKLSDPLKNDSVASMTLHIHPTPGQKTWKDYGLDDLRHIPDSARLKEPLLLVAAINEREAVRVLGDVLGFNQGDSFVVIKSPIEDVKIQRDKLPHTVEKRLDARERYANFIRLTLTDPFEIWETEYENGSRHRYITAYTGDNDIVVAIRVEPDGNVLWNFMQRSDRRMNKLREGELIYFRNK